MGIEIRLYRFTGSGTSHMYTSEFWEFGNMQGPNNIKINICANIHFKNTFLGMYIILTNKKNLSKKSELVQKFLINTIVQLFYMNNNYSKKSPQCRQHFLILTKQLKQLSISVQSEYS